MSTIINRQCFSNIFKAGQIFPNPLDIHNH